MSMCWGPTLNLSSLAFLLSTPLEAAKGKCTYQGSPLILISLSAPPPAPFKRHSSLRVDSLWCGFHSRKALAKVHSILTAVAHSVGAYSVVDVPPAGQRTPPGERTATPMKAGVLHLPLLLSCHGNTPLDISEVHSMAG